MQYSSYVFLTLFFSFSTLINHAPIHCADEQISMVTDTANLVTRKYNHLTLCALCSEKIRARELCTEHAVVDKGYIDELSVDTQEAEYLTVKKLLCTPNIRASNVHVDNILTVSTLYVTHNFEQSQKFRAFVARSNNLVGYKLGSIVNFDTIIDDPNGNVLQNPTRYRVPRSGYYIANAQIDILHLKSLLNEILAGIPVAQPTICVNGIPYSIVYNPFLSFATSQKSHFSALLHLNAGDIVTVCYNILVQDQKNGIKNFVGTADIQGNIALTESLFIIHYLSSDHTPSSSSIKRQWCPSISVSDICHVEKCPSCVTCP